MCIPEFATLETLLVMIPIVPLALLFHSILYVHGTEHRPDRSEAVRIHRRLKWHLLALVLMIGYGQIQNACTSVEWRLVFLMILSMAIWEVFFFVTMPPSNRKKDEGRMED